MVEETIEEKIQYIIEAYVQPSVAMHGGVVSLDEWDNDNRIAYIFMSGACSGCSFINPLFFFWVFKMVFHKLIWFTLFKIPDVFKLNVVIF